MEYSKDLLSLSLLLLDYVRVSVGEMRGHQVAVLVWLELREWGMAGQGDVDVGRSREWGQGLVPAHV